MFGPDGRLVVFGRVPPRIVRNPLTELSVSPSVPSRPGSDSIPRFFKSPALANSKFPRPAPSVENPPPPAEPEPVIAPTREIPEAHLKIPPEVLDPRAMIPPSKFNFRRRESTAPERYVCQVWP